MKPCTSIPFLLATVWAIVDCAQRDFADLRTKVIWMVVAGIPFVGFLIYLAAGMRQGKKP